jgi:hypothetical protein
MKTKSGKASMSLVLGISIVLVMLSGVTYRALASRLKTVVGTAIELPVPLSDFPMQVDSWAGKDVPIPANIQKVAGNDDFLNRLYINESDRQWANVYVAYSARPRTMSGHRPQVCYVGGGWIHDSTEQSQVFTNSGFAVPCLIHRFHKPAPDNTEIVVLNYYILNGQLTNDESGFSGVSWRTPNIGGNAARYIAQIQISSVLENSVCSAAKDFTDSILDYFPDENGNVQRAK